MVAWGISDGAGQEGRTASAAAVATLPCKASRNSRAASRNRGMPTAMVAEQPWNKLDFNWLVNRWLDFGRSRGGIRGLLV